MQSSKWLATRVTPEVSHKRRSSLQLIGSITKSSKQSNSQQNVCRKETLGTYQSDTHLADSRWYGGVSGDGLSNEATSMERSKFPDVPGSRLSTPTLDRRASCGPCLITNLGHPSPSVRLVCQRKSPKLLQILVGNCLPMIRQSYYFLTVYIVHKL